MDERTKMKILATLQEVPLVDLLQKEKNAKTAEDRYFWHNLYILEKGQRKQYVS